MNPHDELNALIGRFEGAGDLFGQVDHVASSLTPEPYQGLLVHNHHMTVTMEDYHGTSVDVRIIDQAHDDEAYCRKIILLKTGGEQVVQFGVVRFNLEYVTSQVRDEILEGSTPLGRVLIKHNVLRHIDLGAILKVTAGRGLAEHLRMGEGEVTYGRLATIFCNEHPAVYLLDVSAPLAPVV